MEDAYKTILKKSQGLYKEKGSKFISYLTPVETIMEVEEELTKLKKIHPKARHICYAYRIGLKGELFRINDNGEPSGTAGRPIYNELLSSELTNALLSIVRYFGGTKLGVSGLIKAYKQSGRDAVLSNCVSTKYVEKLCRIHFQMSDYGKIYNSLKKCQLNIVSFYQKDQPYVDVSQRASQLDQKIHDFSAHFHGVSVEQVLHKSFTSSLKIEEL